MELYPILKFFDYAHLPEHLAKVSEPFYNLARKLSIESPICDETEVALRKLLESKDAAVRAAVTN